MAFAFVAIASALGMPVAHAGTAAQSITFAQPPGKVFGAPPFVVAPSASSKLAVTLTTRTPAICTASALTVTVVAAGTCTLRASQPGNATFVAAAFVDRSVTVSKASQTITFSPPASSTFGAAPIALTASASSHLAVSLTSSTAATCSVSGTTLRLVGAGSCVLHAVQAGNANFAATALDRTIKVAKAAQTITFAAVAPRTFGATPFAVAATATSRLVVTFTSSTAGICAITGASVKLLGAGTCTLRAAQAGDANFNAATAVSQSFPVAKGAQSITFDTIAAHAVSDPPFVLVATASSGAVVVFSSATPTTCRTSGTTLTLTGAGSCSVRASQGGNANYVAAAVVTRTFGVSKAAQSISFAAIGDHPFGGAPFAVAASASSGLVVALASNTLSTCVVSASKISLTATGPCTLRASQSGNANFAAAADVVQTFNVTQVSQSIVFDTIPNHVFGDGPFTLTAVASSGLPVAFASLTPTTCALNASSASIAGAGVCTLRASQAGNGNYGAALPVDRSFTVAKAAQSIAFGVLGQRTLGDSTFVVTGTASSGMQVIFTSGTPLVCSIAGTTVTLLHAGNCRIDANQSGNANVSAAATVSQSFTVAGATQSIRFDAIGDRSLLASPVSAIATASSGLVVTFASTTPGVCAVASQQIALSATGVCTVRASQAGNATYPPAAPVDRSFSVTAITQSITFPPIADTRLSAVIAVAHATASSGLAVRYTSLSTSTCTTDDSTSITLISMGACRVRATQSGNARYSPATDVDVVFNVQDSPTTIVFAPIGTQLLGPTPISLSARSPANHAIVFSALPATTCTVAGALLSMVSTGTCSVSASETLDGVHPSGTPATQRFRILRAPAFMPGNTFSVGPWPAMVIPARFLGGTNVDIAVPWQSATEIFAGDGAGAFTQVGSVTVGAIPMYAATADFNNDGTMDFAVSYIASSAVGLEIGDGKGGFAHPSGWPPVTTPSGLVAIDADGDGNIDMVVASTDSGDVQGNSLTLLFGRGGGNMAPAGPTPVCNDPAQVVAADFDNDAIPDVAYICGRDNSIGEIMFRARGAMNFMSPVGPIPLPYRLAAGDLDGDGNVDLVVDSRYGSAYVLFGNGRGGFSKGPQLDGVGTGDVLIADFNADGIPDLAIADSLNNRISVLAGAGDGSFAVPVVLQTGNYPQGLAVADVDNNGTVDLLFVNMLDGTVSVVRNNAGAPAAAHVVAESAGTQAAGPGQPFASPLVVRVTDSGNSPVPGTLVRFDLGVGSAAAIFGTGTGVIDVTTDAQGIATSPHLRAGITANTYTATARAGSAVTTFTLTNIGGGTAPSFTSTSPPGGTIGSPYAFTLAAAGSPVLRFGVASGTLPAGLTLSADGLLSGTPTNVGTYAGIFSVSNGSPPDAQQSFSITMAMPAQTITFNPISDQSINARAASVSAAASSGLPVAFQSLTPQSCLVGGTTIQLLNVGRCTVRATQSGNATFAAAVPIDRSFTISRGIQTINVTTPEIARMSSPPISITATASSGLPVALSSLTPSVCSVSDSQHIHLNARGTCTLSASQAGNDNYSPAQVTASMQVAGARQIIEFQQPRNGHIDEFTYLLATASSGLPVTLVSLAPEVCKVVLGNVAGIGDDPGAPGNICTIQASQPGDSIYDAALAVSVSFEFGFDPNLHSPLPATPHIVYSRYLGGLGADITFDVVAALDGGAYAGTSVGTTNFPGVSSQQSSNAGVDLLVVSKLQSQTGALDYSVAVGGAASRITATGAVPALAAQQAMAISPSGDVLVAAYASGADWPQTQGVYTRQGPLGIFRIDSAGHVHPLLAAVDPAIRSIRAIASDPTGAVYFTGVADPGLKTSVGAAIDASRVTLSAPYLMKITNIGATVFATYLTVPNSRAAGTHDIGQGTNDALTTSYAVTVDSAGNAYVAGQSAAADFPVTSGALDTRDSKNRDAFVVKVNSGGTALPFVARIGGNDVDRATGIALEPDGSLVVAGKTASVDDFDGRYAFQTSVHFSQGMQTLRVDREFGFVAQLDPMATHLNFMAAIGSFGGDLIEHAYESAPRPLKIAVDAAGSIYAAGTGYPDRSLPVVGMLPGVDDEGVFLMKITANGGQSYSTFIGNGVATGVAADGLGNAYVTGYSKDGEMPTVNAPQADCTAGPLGTCITPFVTKVNDAVSPLLLTTAAPRVDAGNSISLLARLGDLRATGVVDFAESGHVIATVPIVEGTASFSQTPSIGIHHYTAKFRGTGYANGMSSADVMLYATQKGAP